MDIKYQIFENENLFIQKYTGIFSFEKHIQYTRFITEFIKSKSIKKVLIDFRDMDFKEITTDMSEDINVILDKVTKFRKDINKNDLDNKDVKLVIWVDKPLPTVVAHLFVINFSSSNYNYCSTAFNVIQILTLPEHFNDLDSILSNLENRFYE